MSTTRFGVAAPQPLALPPRPCSTEEPRFMHTSIPHGVAPVGRFAALVDSGEALVSARRVEAAELRAGLSRIDRLLDEPQAHVQPYVPRRPQRPASRPGSRRSSSRSSRVSRTSRCRTRTASAKSASRNGHGDSVGAAEQAVWQGDQANRPPVVVDTASDASETVEDALGELHQTVPAIRAGIRSGLGWGVVVCLVCVHMHVVSRRPTERVSESAG